MQVTSATILAVAIVLGVLIFGALVFIAYRLSKRNHPSYELTMALNEATESFGQAVRQSTEVNMVLGVLDGMKQHPELASDLPAYADRVVAAAIMVRINGIHEQIGTVQHALSQAETAIAGDANVSKNWTVLAKRNHDRLTELMTELETVRGIAQRYRMAAAI